MKNQLNSYCPELKIPYSELALNLSFCGCATHSKTVWHWDPSVIEDENGIVHLFLGEWTDDFSNWYKNAKLAHYTSKSPEGPFEFKEYAIAPEMLPGGFTSIFNGKVKKIDDWYVLIYTASRWEGDKEKTLTNQTCCMAYSRSLDGPWEFYHGSGAVIEKSQDPEDWSYDSCCGCTNPCMEKIDGQYVIFYRSGKTRGGAMKYSAVVSDTLFGNYRPMGNGPLTDNINYIEDAECFSYGGNEYLITTDNTGGNSQGMAGDINGERRAAVGLLWKLEDGKFSLQNAQVGFGLISDYVEDMSKATCPDFGAFDKMERPALLVQNGVPTYFYATAYTSVEGTGKSQIYIFKIG